jgi:hypothetical protein
MQEARVATFVDFTQDYDITDHPIPASDNHGGGGILIGIYDSGIDSVHRRVRAQHRRHPKLLYRSRW